MPPHAPESSSPFAAAADAEAIASDAEKLSASPSEPSRAWRRDVQLVGVIFLGSTALLGVMLHSLVVSALTDAEWAALRLPTSLEAAQQLGETLQSFSERQAGALLLAHMGCYLYLQTFAIPGTVFFNLLGGALFGVTLGFPLCLAYNTLGSVLMFLLSRRFGRRVVTRFFPRKLDSLRGMLDAHRDEMALYMIFLRVFPFTPNWFINMASPHLNIPLGQFSLGPLIGLIPYNFLSCKAGLILRELRSRGDIIDTATTVQLIVAAVVGGLVLPRLKKHFATSSVPATTTASIKQE
ncbi:Transmembrane protein 41A [Phytophthora pseudosyringae]|uniref:Transmembrane protein 41A n=1 Tax=Phytophthora pseudosyringae TaxID=221518 RepID=A0A8T1V387_9STRA|nr:Transmembrane protein 41A [Phytophthora pseudosyringae]